MGVYTIVIHRISQIWHVLSFTSGQNDDHPLDTFFGPYFQDKTKKYWQLKQYKQLSPSCLDPGIEGKIGEGPDVGPCMFWTCWSALAELGEEHGEQLGEAKDEHW